VLIDAVTATVTTAAVSADRFMIPPIDDLVRAPGGSRAG